MHDFCSPKTKPMKKQTVLTTAAILLVSLAVRAEVKITVDHNVGDLARPEFKFKTVPSPSTNDAATSAKFTILDGEQDSAGGGVEKLNDGKLPTEEDQPDENFFFNAGTEGGQLQVDLGSVIAVKQVNTRSEERRAGTEGGFRC